MPLSGFRYSEPVSTPSPRYPLIGAHVGASGGLSRAIARACEMGANCLQIFVSAPQQWRRPAHSDTEVDAFCFSSQDRNLHPVFIHAIYLLNPASPDEDLRRKSVDSMREYLRWAARLKAGGVIVHLGSSTGTTPEQALDNLCRSLGEALEELTDVPLLLETSAGTRNSMGSTFAQIGTMLSQLDAGDRAAVCLDTAHVWGAGYDVATPDGLDRTLEEFDREIGMEKLRLIHANDSKVARGAARDRHENIGEGHIGLAGWRVLMAHPLLRHKPWVLETPGLGETGKDREQIALLARLWHGEELAEAS